MEHLENDSEAQQRSFKDANSIPTELPAVQLEQLKTNRTPDGNVAVNAVKVAPSKLHSARVPLTQSHNSPINLPLPPNKCLLPPTIFPPSPAKTPKRGIRPSRGTKPSLPFALSHAFHIDSSPTPTLIGSSTPKRRITDRLPSTPSKRRCPLPLSPRSPPRSPAQPRPPQSTFRAQSFLGSRVAKVQRPKVSSFELKRMAEEILNLVDWKMLAERVALNRRPWIYRKAFKGLLQEEVNRLIETEDRGGGRSYL